MNNFLKYIILLVISQLFFCSCNRDRASEQPNFLFVLVDDLGKEWISSCGADSVQTPFIDRLAKEGMMFNNAYSMPQCTPSRVTLLTGKYPYHHGWINHYDVPRWGHRARFDPELNMTFAQVFKEHGYRTCAAGKWQINDFRLEPDAMVRAGFEEYCMWTGGEGGNDEVSGKRYWDPYIHTKEGSKKYTGSFGPDIFSDFVIEFMKKHVNEPMMIYYPMVLTHGPQVSTPAEPDAVTKIEKHAAMTRYTDIIMKKLVNALEELGIRDKTYLIFTTDNGTASNIIGHRNGRPVRGGKTYLTENGVNAPFLINKPGENFAGKKSDALIDFTDIFPTLLDLAGIQVPEKADIDGHSFAPVLDNINNDPREWILAMGSLSGRIKKNGRIGNWYKYRDRALRDKRYKVYVDTLGKINRLFDLKEDPFENNNLINSQEEVHNNILNYYRNVLKDFPQQDQDPIYEPLDTSIYDVPPEYLVRIHRKDLGRSNMCPPAE